MDNNLNLFKKTMPTIVKQVADWFEIDVTIKLFGVKVFSFTWPPKDEKKSNDVTDPFKD